MSLGQADQILMSRFAFDNARQVFNGQNQGLGPLSWLNYGLYMAEGIGNPIEICEVGEPGKAILAPPSDSDKAKRHADSGFESVSGWRPAIGQKVPKTNWILEKKLGENSFGEVWLGRHTSLKEPQAFKFYFRADRVRSLKRELIDIKLINEKFEGHPNIVGVRETFFDEPPYYLTMDFVNGVDLQTWGEAKGGLGKVPLAIRLDIAEQVANGLQAAHGAGILHRGIKPSNILIVEDQGNTAPGELPKLQVKLTDIGLSHPLTRVLPGMSQAPTGSRPGNPSSAQQYLAPELLTGAKASVGSDIYALGVMLYQLLTGNLQKPAPNNGADEVADPQLRKDLEHCFAGKSDERLASVKQLAGSLHDAAEQHRYLAKQQAANEAAKQKASRRRRLQVAALGVLSALALLAMALLAINAFKNAGRFNADRPEAADKSSG